MANFFLPLCLLALLLHGSTAQFEFGTSPWQSSRQGAQSQCQCRFERLSALEPKRRVQSEGGVTEYFDDNNEQFDCAGVAAIRKTIKPQGLTLPTYFNAPHLIYIIQGRGIEGGVIPGCPETYQSSEQQQQQQGQRATGDQHQRILRFRQGDILAVPAGMAHWCYNDGDSPVVMVMVLDTSNNANQQDNNPRKFSLAGRTSEQDHKSANIFQGFDLQFLADALGVSRELTKKLKQGQDGEMVRVQGGLRVVMPPTSEREEQREEESECSHEQNGLEQTFCTMKRRENIGKPSRADAYTPQAGWYTRLNGQKHPILDFIQMSASRGVLYRSATIAPHWNNNAHDILYVTRAVAGSRLLATRDTASSMMSSVRADGGDSAALCGDDAGEGRTINRVGRLPDPRQLRGQQDRRSRIFIQGTAGSVIAESYKEMSRGEARILEGWVAPVGGL